MHKDIEGREIEPGDLVMRALNGRLTKHYALGYSSKGSLILSCMRDKDNCIAYKGYLDHTKHNSKQYSPYQWSDLYIVEKNAEIPEALLKFMRQ